MIVVVKFVLISLALSRDTTKSLVRSSMWLYSLIWSDSMSDTVAWKFSYCILIFMVCATAISFYSQTIFNSPSSSYYPLNISTFSGNLLSRIALFSDITDISFWIFSLGSSLSILLISASIIALILHWIFCTLET